MHKIVRSLVICLKNLSLFKLILFVVNQKITFVLLAMENTDNDLAYQSAE